MPDKYLAEAGANTTAAGYANERLADMGDGTVAPVISTQVASTTLPTGQVSVAATATQIRPLNLNRRSLVITNFGTATVFVGQDNTVTTTTGHALPAGQSISLAYYTGAVWGIVASGTNPVSFAVEAA